MKGPEDTNQRTYRCGIADDTIAIVHFHRWHVGQFVQICSHFCLGLPKFALKRFECIFVDSPAVGNLGFCDFGLSSDQRLEVGQLNVIWQRSRVNSALGLSEPLVSLNTGSLLYGDRSQSTRWSFLFAASSCETSGSVKLAELLDSATVREGGRKEQRSLLSTKMMVESSYRQQLVLQQLGAVRNKLLLYK